MQINKAIFAIISVLINVGVGFFFELKIKTSDILIIHGFLFLLFFITSLIQKGFLIYKNQPYLILSINFFRIIFCSTFLFFNVLSDKNYEKNYIYNFIIVYFLFLFTEIFLKWKRTIK